MPINKKVGVFEQDVTEKGGYVYTTSEQLSSRMATQRTAAIILENGDFAGQAVLDMGCGDGFFTIKIFDQGKPRSMAGVDAAVKAINIANTHKANRQIHFYVGDAHHLPWKDNSFDLVIVQSILHHDNYPEDMIREAFRLAPKVLIHEPNGNNLGLKIIEKTSRYHREHEEKSYTSHQLKKWITDAGGIPTKIKFV
jgi:ubiquinone/menaquinone biosynthesis C-methylase UbiE